MVFPCCYDDESRAIGMEAFSAREMRGDPMSRFCFCNAFDVVFKKTKSREYKTACAGPS